DECPSLRRAQQADARARREARDELARFARVGEQRLHVIEQRLGDMDLRHLFLKSQQRVERNDRLLLVEDLAALAAREQLALLARAGVAELDLHEEPVELRLGQRERA